MIDFHSHILPGVDDGAKDVHTSLEMLRQSFLQGVDLLIATSHFYGNEEYPREFLNRRNQAFQALQDAMLCSPEVYPRILLGAEVLYFPGISDAEAMEQLMIGSSKSILIEPPMVPWSDFMLDEIVQLGDHFCCTPVIAHVDRYMRYLEDATLIDRVRERELLVQVNGDYFLNPRTVKSAVRNLKNGKIDLIGSDCHNLSARAPNLGLVRKQAKRYGVEAELWKLHENAVHLLLEPKETP